MTGRRRSNADAAALAALVPRLTVDWARHQPTTPWQQLSGSMVSADISGFTRLSERLAQLGPAGAEEMTDILNSYFDGVIAAADRLGGDVLKFGGDQVLVWFSGPGHEQRAAAACVGMRAAADRPFATRTGRPVRMRMSVGAHTGRFSFLMTVGRHREPLIAGADAGETVRGESEAAPGQILVSDALAGRLPRNWLGARLGPRRVLRNLAVADPIDDEGDGRDAPTDLRPYVPSAQRALIAGGVSGEHRHASIGFLDIAGTDDMLAAGGPDRLRGAVARVAAAVDAATAQWETEWLSSDLRPNGIIFMLAGGVPTSSGHDEERLLRTVRQVMDECTDLDLRVGVHRGRVYAGFVGSTTRRGFTMVGDAVNLAARLKQRCGPRELTASRVILDWSDTRFEEQPLEPFLVKGKTQLIEASVLGPIAGRKAKGQAHDLPLVGRAPELAVLERHAERARAGAGSLLVIAGEPGIGKSRLVVEFQRSYDSINPITVAADQYASSTPYSLARSLFRLLAECPADADPVEAGEVLRAWVGAIAPDELPWLPLFALAFGAETPATPDTDDLAAAFRPARLRQTAAAILTRALPEPTLIVLDDVQWADDASAELLTEAFRDVVARPWMVCLLVSGSTVPLWATGAPTLVLDPLSSEEAQSLAVVAATGRLEGGDVARVAGRSGGNPLFLTNLVDAAASTGEGDALPPNIETLITWRIDALETGDRVVLREAAVAGMELDLPLLGVVLGERLVNRPDLWRRLSPFVGRAGPGRLRFHHGLYQRVAYEGLSFRRRREVHLALGDELERQGAEPAVLSLHFERAEDHGRAFRWASIAARAAQRAYANIEAAELYRRALLSEAKRPEPDSLAAIELAEALGDVLELNADYDAAATAYADARRRVTAGQPHVAARLHRKVGVLRERAGAYSEALRWYSRAIRRLDVPVARADGMMAEERSELAELQLAYAGVRHRQGDVASARAWTLRAMENASLAGDAAVLGHASYLLILIEVALGSPSPESIDAALTLLGRSGDLVQQAKLFNNLGIAAYFAGDWDRALECYERSREVSHRAGDLVSEATVVNNLGEILSDRGRTDEAITMFTRSLETFRSARYPIGVALTTGNLGRALLRRGEHDEAHRLLVEARQRFEGIGAASFVAEMLVRLAEWAVGVGDPAQALTSLDQAQRRAGVTADPSLAASVHRVRAKALLALDRVDEATAEADLAVRRAVTGSFELGRALQTRADARARLAAAAERDAEQATEVLAALGVVP